MHTHRTISLIFLQCFFHQQVGNVYWPHNFTSFQVLSRENGRDIVGSVKVTAVKMRAIYTMACIPLVIFCSQTDRRNPFSFDFIVPREAMEFESLVHPLFMSTAPHDAKINLHFVTRYEHCLHRLVDLPIVPRASPSFSVGRIPSVIILVIKKSDSHCADVLFCYHSYDYKPEL